MQRDYPSLVFPEIHQLPQALASPRLRSDVLLQIHSDPDTLAAFQALAPDEQEAFLGFCMGERGLKVTFDPFFKYILDPERHPGRLDRLLSSILKQRVIVRKVLTTQRRRISKDSSLIIMDILVQLADGSLVNVEMQRIGYDFPIERGFCYGADLLVRQYDVAKKKLKKRFSYRSIKPVYVIALMEESPREFHRFPSEYIHRSDFRFRTGLKMKSLLNFIYIPLDIFRRMYHNSLKGPDAPLTELEAWMLFLSSDEPADILRLTTQFPFFHELYRDIVAFRFNPKELIAMYSEALRIMDENTVHYMIDELKAEVLRKDKKLSAQKAALSTQQAELSRKDSELLQKDSELSKKDSELSAQKAELSQKDSEIERLRQQLAKYEGHG